MDRGERLRGALLGLAIGDAMGLPFEGMSRRSVQRRFARAERFRLLGGKGIVSDDTEQTALLAWALAASSDDAEVVRRFRRAMVGWLARLPFGIGWGTLRACVRMSLGMTRPGVPSAGNGAAMRAGVLGAYLADQPARRRILGPAVARLTHTDPRGVEAALFVAEVAAGCARGVMDRVTVVASARAVVEHVALRAAIDDALELARGSADSPPVVLGNTGFVVHTVGLCTFCFVRFGSDPISGIEAAIRAGGDTDTHAAIVGGWLGALHGEASLPNGSIDSLLEGPFGPTHLRALGDALAADRAPPRWSWWLALVRNLALWPVIVAHGLLRRLTW